MTHQKMGSPVFQNVETCPACHSLFFIDGRCESCHYILPILKDSFFEIKERYLESLSSFEALFPRLERRKKSQEQHYLVALISRLRALESYFHGQSSKDQLQEEGSLLFCEYLFLLDELIYEKKVHGQSLNFNWGETEGTFLGRLLPLKDIRFKKRETKAKVDSWGKRLLVKSGVLTGGLLMFLGILWSNLFFGS